MVDIVGRARATALGYYPDDGVHFRFIQAGEEFDVVAGREKGSWFERVVAEPEAGDAPSVAPRSRKGKAAQQTADPEAGADDAIV